MAYVLMNRTRALIICARPQDYAPTTVHDAIAYLLVAHLPNDPDVLELARKARAYLLRDVEPPRKPAAPTYPASTNAAGSGMTAT